MTQNEDAPSIEDQLNESTLLKAVSKVNPLYATVLGNPFECQEMDESSDRYKFAIFIILCCFAGSYDKRKEGLHPHLEKSIAVPTLYSLSLNI